jgi:hypothetical protein
VQPIFAAIIAMEKKFALLVVFAVFAWAACLAQDDAEIIKTKRDLFKVNNAYNKPSKDYVMLQAGYHGWQLPDTFTAASLSNRGSDLAAYICLDLPMQKKHISFAPGIGIGVSNIYLKNQTVPLTRFGTDYTTIKFEADTLYKRYKFTVAYLEAPLEFRYYANADNRNRGFKMSVGATVGALIKTGTKGVLLNGGGNVKEKSRRYNEQWRINAVVRAGYGNFSIYGKYQVTEVFKAGNPQSIRPI